jgi:S-adenosylmethionine-diacylglycerol 3-amino-3-carboxypropyl transferase
MWSLDVVLLCRMFPKKLCLRLENQITISVSLDSQLNKLRDKFFEKIHSNNLIYNTCWEDPRVDRQLLSFNSESRVAMITSAGCNALDYLLDDVASVDCIDMNPKQNALLQLKIALFNHGNYEKLFELFGNGAVTVEDSIYDLYFNHLKKNMPQFATAYWDKKIHYFSGVGRKKSFYFYGTSGTFAWLFKQFFDTKKSLKTKLLALLDAPNQEKQVQIATELEPELLSPTINWLMNRHITLTLLGVPRAQRQLILEKYPGGMAHYLKDSYKQVFLELPISDNYFWRLYITGKYTPTCCPEYLKASNFELLRSRVSRINTHTTTLTDFLQSSSSTFTHFILLDHQDWLAAYNPQALEQEWRQILEKSESGSQILMRSAAPKITFLPDFVKERLVIDEEKTMQLHKLDRVGTYAGILHAYLK